MSAGEEDTGQVVLQAAAVPSYRGRRYSREAEVLGAAVLLIGGAFLYPYVAGLAGALTPPCLLHRITGLPCLLCGMTRSLAATAHGHLGEAFRFHLLGPPLFVLTLAAGAVLVAEFALSRRLVPRTSRRALKYMGWGMLGLLAAAWIARLVFFGINI